jgi:beta-lactamase superfamily II metal-dependent hydrolase
MTLHAIFWDVQHGNAAYVQTPGGEHIVIDLGHGSLGTGGPRFSPLLYLRDRWNVSQLDAVIITHPHRDHLDDIGNFNALSPRVLRRPQHLAEADIRGGNREVDQPIIDQYLEINARYNAPVADNENPLIPPRSGGAYLRSFTPTGCNPNNLNNHSVVTVIEYARSKILVPGDNEAASWRELLERQDFREAIQGTDVLLASHHGRREGFSEELFEHITPKLVVISDGPVGDTSVTSDYAAEASGWTVHRRNGEDVQRRVLTTRHDGAIEIVLGFNANDQPFLSVTVD